MSHLCNSDSNITTFDNFPENNCSTPTAFIQTTMLQSTETVPSWNISEKQNKDINMNGTSTKFKYYRKCLAETKMTAAE